MTTYFAVPTEHTYHRLIDIMSGAPIHLEAKRMAVRIASGSGDGQVSDTTYSAKVTSLERKYNEELQYFELLAVLDCPELVARARELGAGEDYEPALIVQSPATPHGRTNKSWIASVHDTLVSKEGPFTFVERVISG